MSCRVDGDTGLFLSHTRKIRFHFDKSVPSVEIANGEYSNGHQYDDNGLFQEIITRDEETRVSLIDAKLVRVNDELCGARFGTGFKGEVVHLTLNKQEHFIRIIDGDRSYTLHHGNMPVQRTV